MARILCLDYGNVRLGVAISDPDNILAMAREYINVKKGNVLGKLKSLIAENGCEEIVIGLPISLNGQDTQKTVEVRTFATKLEELL
ncbi:MAG TPA: pre-16S rRNA-processing nuclease YqgF, partial [Spirochaetes bacterium]|nr:pre-16S rRNA-processing nuclease YqgF [Spirochaetota bacterium]